MSRLPFTTRAMLAARLYECAIEAHDFAAEADAGFDGGEWSGPAHGRMLERDLAAICARLLVRRETVDRMAMCRPDSALFDAMYGDDPLGDWHGRNE